MPVPPVDDELAQVTRSFNRMAAALEDTETTRRRLLADLAHELRTPLATLEGYIEGLDDGVVAAEPATWQTLADALGRLGRLVDAMVSHVEEPPDELAQVTRSFNRMAAALEDTETTRRRGCWPISHTSRQEGRGASPLLLRSTAPQIMDL